MEHSLPQRAVSEALGTALLVLVGPGSVVATLALAGKSTPAITGADLLGIAFAFGLIITALVYALGKVSGCHINPAVTFALAATKRFPWREVPSYWAAQVVGAVLGALGIWALFGHTGIDLGMGQTSFNQDATTWASAIFAEGIGTFMLMYAILGIVDSRSPGDFAGLIIGGVVVAIIMVVGPVTGASLNPARAFGPELVANDWKNWWVWYVGPLAGAVIAAVMYELLYLRKPEAHAPEEVEPSLTNADEPVLGTDAPA
jgi:glycerol uptake facilitator protein